MSNLLEVERTYKKKKKNWKWRERERERAVYDNGNVL
jgi:hypothetical protein